MHSYTKDFVEIRIALLRRETFGKCTRETCDYASIFGEHLLSFFTTVVKQQFEIGKEIIAAGLVPIIEPEVDINCPEKAAAEILLEKAILAELDSLNADQNVMLKLTLPDHANFYSKLVAHPRVIKVVALSGG